MPNMEQIMERISRNISAFFVYSKVAFHARLTAANSFLGFQLYPRSAAGGAKITGITDILSQKMLFVQLKIRFVSDIIT